jgi:hypothetical protein
MRMSSSAPDIVIAARMPDELRDYAFRSRILSSAFGASRGVARGRRAKCAAAGGWCRVRLAYVMRAVRARAMDCGACA